MQRQAFGNPYLSSASHLSNFPFASRLSTAPDAPLFHSTVDEFREDDEEEQEREWADRYALERSRRVWGASHLEESSETDNDRSRSSLEGSRDGDARVLEDRGRGRGIKSSWNGGIRNTREGGRFPEIVEEPAGFTKYRDRGRQSSRASSGGKGKMVDIGLESTIDDGEPPEDLAIEMPIDDSPPAFQQFRSIPKISPIGLNAESKDLSRHRDPEPTDNLSRPPSSETVPPTVPTMIGEPPKHDMFWGSLYLICLASLFATFFLVFLHTSTPNRKVPLGDTIYTTLRSSFHLLAVDTVVSVIVSLIWLALLRSFVRPLVYLILLSVPVILFSFSLYPLIASYKGDENSSNIQDKVMRWLSLAPTLFALLWLYTVYKGRHSLTRAIGILEFSSRILASNPALLPLGLATLLVIIVWTWIWLGMFTRVFLAGHLSGSLFVIDSSTWLLGAFFVLMYLWTLSVTGGIQRATTAATVSQWYFHRNMEPSPNSKEIAMAAVLHAITTLFGTVCLSSLLSLLIRIPILILPHRMMSVMSIFAYSLVPTPVAALINPLTLTYAAIQSQPLSLSARSLSQMSFIGSQLPTTNLTSRAFSSRTQNTPHFSYRLAKLLLHATRYIMAIALGFGGWVTTARQLSIDMPGGVGLRGSAYAYVVGLVASFIGWGVLGSIEGVLSGIVDASVVCWGIEKGTAGGGAYCLEAGYLFGESRERENGH